MNDRKVRGLSGATVLTLVVFLFVILWLTNQFDQKDEEINWKEFEELVTKDKLGKVVVNQNKNVPTGRVEIELKDRAGEVKYLYVSDVNDVQDYLQGKNISADFAWSDADLYHYEQAERRSQCESDEFREEPREA